MPELHSGTSNEETVSMDTAATGIDKSMQGFHPDFWAFTYRKEG